MNAKKRKNLVCMCCGVVLLIGLFGIFWLSRPRESSIELWSPEKVSFANLIGGKYTSVEKVSVSGTAIFVPLNQYQERFPHSDHTIIVQENGDVYYLTRTNKETYVSTKKWFWTVADQFLRAREVTHIDSSLGVATISCTRDWIGVAFVSAIFIVVTIVIARKITTQYG